MNNLYLENITASQYFNQNELKMLFSHNQMINFDKGNIILQQGKKSDGIYLIIEGIVNVRAKMLGEGLSDIENLGPGNFLGEISFIERVPCATSVIATEKVKCLYINHHFFELLAAFFPNIKYKIYYAIAMQVCARLKKMHSKIAALIIKTKMTTRSLVTEVIQSFTRPEKIALEDYQNKEQLKQLFLKMNEDETNTLLLHSTLLNVAKNCILIKDQQKNPCCYVVIQGAVQSNMIEDNKIAKLSVIGPNTLFSSIAFLDPQANFTIHFSTCEQAVLLQLSRKELNLIKNEKKQLWYKLFYSICRSYVALEKSMDKLYIRLKIEEYNR